MKRPQMDLKSEAVMAEIVAELKALPRRESGHVSRVPKELRDRVVKLLGRSGISVSEASARFGVTGNAIRTWMRACGKKAPKRAAGFRRLRVGNSEIATTPQTSGGLTLELSGGARVHGLSVDELARLLSVAGQIS